MTYLIRYEGKEPFFTTWYDYESHYINGMVIFNITTREYSDDGVNFYPIKSDHL